MSRAEQVLAPGGEVVAAGAVRRHIVSPHVDLQSAAAGDTGGTGRPEVPPGGHIITENLSRGQLHPVRAPAARSAHQKPLPAPLAAGPADALAP